tara:strand:+ start:2068 stop:2283 length:216 start_codon:yes stop_codon:yes gene_type:complete
MTTAHDLINTYARRLNELKTERDAISEDLKRLRTEMKSRNISSKTIVEAQKRINDQDAEADIIEYMKALQG